MSARSVSSNLCSRIDRLVSKLLDWTEHDHAALRRSAASLLRDAQAELVRQSPVETTVSIPRELLERLAWEHRDTSKYTHAVNELRTLLRFTQETTAQRIGSRIPHDIGLRGPNEEGITAPGEELLTQKCSCRCHSSAGTSDSPCIYCGHAP